MHPVLRAWTTMGRLPLGEQAFSFAVAQKAPYFATVRPRFRVLEVGHGEITAPLRRRVKNHLGTFHAIAMCNMAEVVAGIVTEVSVPPTHRWIPKGMTVAYLAKAATDLRATVDLPDLAGLDPQESRDVVAPVYVVDRHGTVVAHADITMWVSPRPAR